MADYIAVLEYVFPIVVVNGMHQKRMFSIQSFIWSFKNYLVVLI